MTNRLVAGSKGRGRQPPAEPIVPLDEKEGRDDQVETEIQPRILRFFLVGCHTPEIIVTAFRGKGNFDVFPIHPPRPSHRTTRFSVNPPNPIRCVVTAGPTREPIDPVRFISNPSTGKMGFAIAAAAVEAGWTVDLISGPTHLTEPPETILYPVGTGEEMYHQVDAVFDACDVLIMTAAVVDFRPKHPMERKEKKGSAQLTLEMEPVIDILKAVTWRKRDQFVVGFAAETNDLETYARGNSRKRISTWSSPIWSAARTPASRPKRTA